MSDARDGFDAIGVVVDWIDACKQRRLDDLLDLYDVTATDADNELTHAILGVRT